VRTQSRSTENSIPFYVLQWKRRFCFCSIFIREMPYVGYFGSCKATNIMLQTEVLAATAVACQLGKLPRLFWPLEHGRV
jgi:hypothetical protein